jgi:hypothetical protein
MNKKRLQNFDVLQPDVLEHEGHRIGDVMYCTVRGAVCRGTINFIYLKEGSVPHFSFTDEASQQNRVALFSDIIKEPAAKHMRAVEKEIRKNQTIKS